MAPKKSDDKVEELIQRFVAVEGKLSTMDERMNEMMRMMASGFERLEMKKVDQTEGKNRREEGLISSGSFSNPIDALNRHCIRAKDRERRSWRNQ